MKRTTTILLNLLAALLILPTVSALRPQGAGEDLVAVTEANGHLYAIRQADGGDQIVRSTDNGLTFEELMTAEDEELTFIAVHGNIGFAGGGDLLLRAPDLAADAENWEELVIGFDYFGLFAIAGNGAGAWAVAGTDESVYKTTDDGDTWTDISIGNGIVDITAIAWNPATGNWIAVGGNTVYEYDGNGWNKTVVGNANLTRVAVDGTGNVMAAGENGALYLRPAGGSFEPVGLESGSSENFHTVLAVGDNDFVAGGDQRGLLRITDGTATELLATQEGPVTVNQIAYLDGAVVMAGVERVDPPEISAVNDPENPVTVTLTADDNIYYTTDGSAPETGSFSSPPTTGGLNELEVTVTGTVTVLAVAEKNGVFSPLASQEVIAGEALDPFALTVTEASASGIQITQDASNTGVVYQLQYTTDLTADPQEWENEAVPTQTGTGAVLTWEITPAPASLRFWRSIVAP